MKGATALLAVLASFSLALQPVIGAAVPTSATAKESGTKSAAVPNNKASSVVKATGSKATGTAVPSGKSDTKISGATGQTESAGGKSASAPKGDAKGNSTTKGDGQKLPECSRKSYGGLSANEIDKLWKDSGSEKYVDEWLGKRKDHSNWAQELYMELFTDVDQTEMSCITTGAECQMEKTCQEFNAIGKGGLYYLFQSMQAYHKFMAETRTRFSEASFISATGVKDTISKLKINVDRTPQKVNILGMLNGAMGIASGFAGPIGAGALSVLGGVMDKMAEEAKGANPLELQNASEEMINTEITKATKANLNNIDTLLSAVFGNKVSQDEIPKSMRKANVKNPALAVFGGGRWLMDNPTQDLASHWTAVGKLMKQGIAWQLARAFRYTWIIIRDDMKQGDCKNKNNAWDGTKSRCIDMMGYDETPRGTFGGINDIDMWTDFGMDKLATMKNAVDCWESNQGKEGAPGLLTEPFKSKGIPPCFFAHVVRKGHWYSKDKGYIRMDGGFAGQSTMNNVAWPENRN